MESLPEGGFLIAKIHQLSGRIFSKILKKSNIEINPGQGRILFALWREDKISIQELAKKTLLGKSTLTSMLDRLEEAGYLTRIPSKNDRRKILITLTKKNNELKNKYLQVSDEMNEIFYRSFASDEVIKFESSLKRVLENLTEFKE
jgi:DNA-binding MarR family transcriptional regulator